MVRDGTPDLPRGVPSGLDANFNNVALDVLKLKKRVSPRITLKRPHLHTSRCEVFSARFEPLRKEDGVTLNVYFCLTSRNGNQGKPDLVFFREDEQRITIFKFERA